MQGSPQPAVRLERSGTVAVLVIDAAPVNALGAAVRAGLMAGIAASAADPGVQAVLIRGEGRGFSAGADIAEFGKPPATPLLAEVIAALEALEKPVIAALHGNVLGGGLELALGAHHRIADAEASFGLPEVLLGLLPGAGGTQRTPRLIGAALSLDLMLTGRRISAAEALATGLIDGLVENDLTGAALTLAAELGAKAAAGRRPVATRDRRDGMADPAAFLAEVAAARQAASGRLPALQRIVDCVEAAQLLSFEQGMAFERAAFVEMRDSPESAGLRHAFQAERRAARVPEAHARPGTVTQAAVIGLGEEGAAFALALAAGGVPVTVLAEDREGLSEGLGYIAAAQETQVAEGRLTEAARDANWSRITPATDLAVLPAADLVVVVLPEGGVLPGVFAHLRQGAVLASASASPDLDALAAATGRAGDVIGLRLTLPRLVELSVGRTSSPEAVATGFALARRIGCVAVRVAAGAGLILPRMQAALHRAADHLLAKGAAPAALNAALQAFGLPLGPRPAAVPAETAPNLGAEEMRRRCLTALANEGARLVGEGTALRPSDIDAAMVASAAFPRWEGGPMFWAGRRGLLVLRADIRRWGETAPADWQVAPLIDELIRTGRSFADLDAA